MCKGISFVVTKNNCYWHTSNSHENIKEEYKIRDTKEDELLIVELYPRGVKFLSEKIEDWELVTENRPAWYMEDEEEVKGRIYSFLFTTVFTAIRSEGIADLTLSDLGYKRLPDFGRLKISFFDCCSNELEELVVPCGLINLICSNNKIRKLIVPDGVKYLRCLGNRIKQLELPKSVRYVDCSFNGLEELILYKDTEVESMGNNISYLQIRK